MTLDDTIRRQRERIRRASLLRKRQAVDFKLGEAERQVLELRRQLQWLEIRLGNQFEEGA
jgi:hypothetical protein